MPGPRLRATFALLGAVVVVAGCTVPGPAPPTDRQPGSIDPPVVEQDPDGRGGGTLRIGLSVAPVSIDPRFVADDEGELVVGALFDPLVRLDERFQVVPAAAESWEIDASGTRFTFHLAEASFHDGTPVTAEDFRRAFARIADGGADPLSFLDHLLAPVVGADEARAGGELAGVEVVDERTLRIRLSDPHPRFLEILTNPALVPLPPAADDLEEFGRQPIGNGPFQLAEPRDGQPFLRLSRYADHPSPAELDEVLLQVYEGDPSRDRQWQDLLDGQLQVAEIPPDRLEEAEDRFGASEDGYTGPGLLTGTTSTVYLYGFDTTTPPFDDERIRRAVSLAIDRTALAEEVMSGTRLPATSIVPPPFPGAQPGACDHCRHDRFAARRLLAEAQADGVELESFTLDHQRGRTHAAIAERMAADIEEALAVEVRLAGRDLGPFVRAARAGELPVFRLGWSATEPGAGAWLYPLFHSSQIGVDNWSRFGDEEVDDLLEQARTSPLRSDALFAHRAAERRILAAAPAIPLLWYRHARVVTPEVEGLTWTALGRVDLAAVSLDPDAR